MLYDEDGTWIDINRDTLIDALDGMPVDMFIANNDHIDTEDVTNNDEVIMVTVVRIDTLCLVTRSYSLRFTAHQRVSQRLRLWALGW